jgi:spore coat protein A
MAARAYPFAQSPTTIRKFVTSLPGLGPAGANSIGQYIPLATKHSLTFAGKKTDLYDLVATQFSERMHPDLAGKTDLFGYSDIFTGQHKYLGGVIVAARGTPVLLSATNLLPRKHILPVDPTIMAGPNGLMVGDLPTNRMAVHLHGGLTPWFSDGTPYQWITPFGQHGPSFMNVPGTFAPPGTLTNYYPNDQSARMVWYHDHAIGITRLNAYAGLASAYIITDAFETFLINNALLPSLVGIPMILQEKTFVANNILTQDPTWKWGNPGDLWYPHQYEFNSGPAPACTLNAKGRWDYGPCVTPPAVLPASNSTLPSVSAVPEFFADTAMVNGALYPTLTVKAQTFRFRVLNASQARFFHLNLYYEDPTNHGEVPFSIGVNGKPVLAAVPGPSLYQVATEGGFLPAYVQHPNGIPCPLDLVGDKSGNTANPDGPFNLLVAPAERADFIINFSGLNGKSFILYNDAPGPFPMGDSRNDYFTGDPDQTAIGGAPTTVPGHGPNTRTIMKIIVDNAHGAAGGPFPNLALLNTALAQNFTGGNPGVAPQQPTLLAPFNSSTGQFEIPSGMLPFNKTLNEDFDDFGRLLQRGGTDQQFTNNQGLLTFGQGYMDPTTETVSAGAVQAWDFYNTTGDTHPWHFHLVNVQVVGRGIYATNLDGTPIFGSFTDLSGSPGKLTPPDANEQGWKETVRMNPGEITRVIMRFDLPKLPKSMGDPKSPRTGGHEYVHHCHILEHEEHDMMRTLVVT